MNVIKQNMVIKRDKCVHFFLGALMLKSVLQYISNSFKWYFYGLLTLKNESVMLAQIKWEPFDKDMASLSKTTVCYHAYCYFFMLGPLQYSVYMWSGYEKWKTQRFPLENANFRAESFVTDKILLKIFFNWKSQKSKDWRNYIIIYNILACKHTVLRSFTLAEEVIPHKPSKSLVFIILIMYSIIM